MNIIVWNTVANVEKNRYANGLFSLSLPFFNTQRRDDENRTRKGNANNFIPVKSKYSVPPATYVGNSTAYGSNVKQNKTALAKTCPFLTGRPSVTPSNKENSRIQRNTPFFLSFSSLPLQKMYENYYVNTSYFPTETP